MSKPNKSALREGIAKRGKGIRYALIGVALILGVLVIAFPVLHFFLDPNVGPTAGVPDLPPTTVEQPALTSLQAVRAAFAPWMLAPGNTGRAFAPDLVMLNENGSVEASAATVDFRPQDWTSTRPFDLRTVNVRGSSVDINTSGGKLFTIAVQQPFILEQQPQYVYLVTDDGTVWQAPAQAVKAMQK